MAPIKFEEHIKDELQGREIKPSVGAWDKISKNLESPKELRKSAFFWYSIAASFIGLLIVSVLFFKTGNSVSIENKVVEQETKIEKKETQNNKEQEVIKEILPVIIKEKQEEQLAQVPQPKGNTEGEARLVKSSIQEEVLVQNENNNFIEDSAQKVLNTPEKIIEAKLAEVIAQANSIEENNNNALTDAEVDSLLRQAQKELLTNKIFKDNNTVDAMALLSDVEGELDQSFRNQIFEKLKAGFLKVRTAVADRNN